MKYIFLVLLAYHFSSCLKPNVNDLPIKLIYSDYLNSTHFNYAIYHLPKEYNRNLPILHEYVKSLIDDIPDTIKAEKENYFIFVNSTIELDSNKMETLNQQQNGLDYSMALLPEAISMHDSLKSYDMDYAKNQSFFYRYLLASPVRYLDHIAYGLEQKEKPGVMAITKSIWSSIISGIVTWEIENFESLDDTLNAQPLKFVNYHNISNSENYNEKSEKLDECDNGVVVKYYQGNTNKKYYFWVEGCDPKHQKYGMHLMK